MSNQNAYEEIPIACDLSVFTDEEREKHMADAAELFAKVTEVKELDEGYAIRVTDEAGILRLIADFIHDESRCCPFFHFTLEVEPKRRAIWLKLIGAESVKVFLAPEMAQLLPKEVAIPG